MKNLNQFRKKLEAMDKTEKLAEHFGVEIGEPFFLRLPDGKKVEVVLSEYGTIVYTGTQDLIPESLLCDIIIGEVTVEHKSRFSEDELHTLRLLYSVGVRCLVRNRNDYLFAYDGAQKKEI